MDADELLTAKQKREARAAIDEFIESAIHSSIRSEAHDLARKWMKEHRKEIETMVDVEMKKKIPHIVSRAIEYI